MAAIVSLRKVVDEIDAQMDECTAYLNRETGELYTVRDEERKLLDEDIDLDDLPAWQREALPIIRDVLESEEWLPLPSKFDIHEWEIMDQFSRSVEDPDLRNELLNAIRGSGAFRFFKATIYRHRIQETWYRYRTAALERIAIDWLDQHGIAHSRDEDARQPPN